MKKIVLTIGGCQQQNSIPTYELQAEESVQLTLEQKLAAKDM